MDECIPGLIRYLSFKIAFDLALADPGMGISAKTWRGFMNFTEALEAYYNYTQTGKSRDLTRSRKSCIRAVYSEKEYNKAIEMLDALGFVHAEKKDYHEAQKIFKIVSKFKMDLGSFGLGYLFGLQNKNEDALAAYDRAIGINPQYSEAWNNKGVELGELNRPKEALTAFEKAIELNPQYSDAWYNKGVALGNLDRPEEGLTAFEKAIELNPQYSKAWYNKGVVLGNLDRPEKALAAYDRAIGINPQYSEAWNNKGVVLDKLNRPEEALTACEKAIELNPQFSKPWYAKGLILKALHRETESEEAFSRAKELGFTGPSET